jgi:molecular chaperone DnaJ
MGKNYYLILGVQPDASPEQIKSAYRHKVKELHPDHYGEDCQPFLALQEAYNTLSDPNRRANYDKQLENKPRVAKARPVGRRPGPVEPLIPHEEPSDRYRSPRRRRGRSRLDQIFEQVWGGYRDSSFGGIEEIEIAVELTPLQARQGGQARLVIPVPMPCPACRGYGGIGFGACRRCGGTGAVLDRYPLLISIPPGVTDGERMSLPLDRVGLPDFHLTLHFAIMGF